MEIHHNLTYPKCFLYRLYRGISSKDKLLEAWKFYFYNSVT